MCLAPLSDLTRGPAHCACAHYGEAGGGGGGGARLCAPGPALPAALARCGLGGGGLGWLAASPHIRFATCLEHAMASGRLG